VTCGALAPRDYTFPIRQSRVWRSTCDRAPRCDKSSSHNRDQAVYFLFTQFFFYESGLKLFQHIMLSALELIFTYSGGIMDSVLKTCRGCAIILEDIWKVQARGKIDAITELA
jgi:hypothetical protein